MTAETRQPADAPALPAGSGNDRRHPKGNLTGWILIPAWLIFAATAAAYAFCTSASYFAGYDDEGFMMIGVRGFMEGHPLYNDVFTFYGPFYYFYQWFLHSIVTAPLTHDAMRIICILHWFSAALLLALAGRAITRSTLVAFLVFAQAMLHLTPLAREPGHPQELIALLLPLAMLIAAKRPRSRWASALLGGVCAALAFTKINVGVFFGLGLVLAFSCQTSLFQKRRPVFWLWLLLLSSLPCLLMRPNLGEAWTRAFCGQACIAILTAGSLGYVFSGERKITRSQWLAAGCAMIGTCVLLLTIVLLKGTSLSSMVDQLIVGPARVGGSFSIPLKAPFCSWSGAAALVSAALLLCGRKRLERLSFVLALAKVLYGVIGALVLLTDYNRQLAYLLPWSWLLIVPVGPERTAETRENFPRIFLCLVSIWQNLQAYPIAGTQVVIGTLLSLLVYSICLHDGIIAFAALPQAANFRERFTPRTAVAFKALALMSLFYVFVMQWCHLPPVWRYYTSMTPLGLPGSRLLRLPPDQVEPYRALSQYLENECDAFITIPGMNSLYFWTRKTPPTYLNVFEVVLLNDRQQERVIAALQKARRPLIVLNEQRRPDAVSTGPLQRLIVEQSHEVARFGSFRLLKPEPADRR